MKILRPLLLFTVILSMLLPTVLSSCSQVSYDVVMEYNGIKLTEDKYYYWMSTFKRNILSSYSDAFDTEAFWNGKYDDERTVEEYFTEVINRRIVNYLIAQDIYKKHRLTMPEEDRKAIEEDIREKISYYGSRGALNKELSTLKLNIDSLKDVYTWEEKHDTVYDYLFGEGGEYEISDSRLGKYFEENYGRIQYIVFYTTKIQTNDKGDYVYDENGDLITEEMTDKEKQELQGRIDACMTELEGGAAFADMQNKYSQYNTLEKYPNGFYLSANEVDIWGPEIVLAVKNAEVGEVVRVEEESAVFIVKRCELPAIKDVAKEDVTEQLGELAAYATKEIYDEVFDTLSKDVTVYSDVLNHCKLSKIKANPYFSI